MADKATSLSKAKPRATREDRLKAALKENMARRKAQARARDGAKPAGQDKISTSAKDAQ